MLLINKPIIIRCCLYVVLSLLGYITGLLQGRHYFYNVGKLNGCTKLARLDTGNRCVINRDNHLMLEIEDDSGVGYIFIDDLN